MMGPRTKLLLAINISLVLSNLAVKSLIGFIAAFVSAIAFIWNIGGQFEKEWHKDFIALLWWIGGIVSFICFCLSWF